MDREEFLRQIETWREELEGEVISFYRRGDQERGGFAFDRWRDRVDVFLQRYAPNEAKSFNRVIRLSGFVIVTGEPPYATFMREYGNSLMSFLDDLEYSLKKDRVEFYSVPQDVQLQNKDEMEEVLSLLTSIKDMIDTRVEKETRYIMVGVGLTVVGIWIAAIILTFLVGWDVAEPYTFFVPTSFTIGAYAIYLVRLREFTLNPLVIYKHTIEFKKKKAYKKIGLDIERYDALIDV